MTSEQMLKTEQTNISSYFSFFREAISHLGRIFKARSFTEKCLIDKFLIMVYANSQSQQSRRFISHLQRNFDKTRVANHYKRAAVV